MSRQIIKQPNGKYALFSSVVDDFVLIDADPNEIVEELVAYYELEARRQDCWRCSALKTLSYSVF